MESEKLLPRIGMLCVGRLEISLVCMETALLGRSEDRLNYETQRYLTAILLRAGPVICYHIRAVVAAYRILLHMMR